MYVCTYVWNMHLCMCVCMYVCMYVCMFIYIYVCMYVCIDVYICVSAEVSGPTIDQKASSVSVEQCG
jgi:hypothetical protein